MIEFLPPRDHAFGDADAADFVGLDDTDDTDDTTFDDEPPQSRPDRAPIAPRSTAASAPQR